MSAESETGTFRNIVVGISEAATSHLAARHAVGLAELCGATLHFVTAVEKNEHEVVQIASDRFEFDTVEASRDSIERIVRSLAPSVEHTVSVVVGSPAKALIQKAEECDADLIVVGNVRMQGIGRVLGSVGNEVVHHAPCSVLIVKTV